MFKWSSNRLYRRHPASFGPKDVTVTATTLSDGLLHFNSNTGEISLLGGSTFGRTSTGYVQDYAGTYTLIAAGYPRIQGARYSGNTPYYLLADGTALHPTRGHNGATFLDTYPIWTAGTVYATNARVIPTATTNLAAPAGGDGYWYYASTGGTSHATTEPTWAAGPVSDGTAAWTRGGYYRIGGYLHEQQATNAISYSSTLSNAAWGRYALGTGVAPAAPSAVSSVAPDGGIAWRAIFDRGAGTTSGDWSVIDNNAPIGGLNKAQRIYVWMKSYDSNTYTVAITNGNVFTTQTVCTVTPDWQKYTLYISDLGANNRQGIAIGTFGDTTGQTADVLIWCPVSLYSSAATVLLSGSPIQTTDDSVVTRAADTLTLTTTILKDAAGTLIADVQHTTWSSASGQILGDGTEAVLRTAASVSGAVSEDGTNSVNGPVGTPSGVMRQGVRWTGTTLQVAANGTAGTAGTYDTSFNLASLTVGSAYDGLIRNLRAYQSDVGATAVATMTAKDAS